MSKQIVQEVVTVNGKVTNSLGKFDAGPIHKQVDPSGPGTHGLLNIGDAFVDQPAPIVPLLKLLSII
jgi:hypothetical protein